MPAARDKNLTTVGCWEQCFLCTWCQGYTEKEMLASNGNDIHAEETPILGAVTYECLVMS
jgi:hypothetical protein